MNFDQKIAQAVRQAVKDAFDLDAEENALTIDTPKDPKLGDYASSAACCRHCPFFLAVSACGDTPLW